MACSEHTAQGRQLRLDTDGICKWLACAMSSCSLDLEDRKPTVDAVSDSSGFSLNQRLRMESVASPRVPLENLTLKSSTSKVPYVVIFPPTKPQTLNP